MVLGVAGGAAQDGAESAGGGERLPDVLRLVEVVALVRDDERVAQVGGEGARAFGEAPQLEQVRVEAREFGLRPLARPRGRVRLTAARLLRVHVVIDQPRETAGERLRHAGLHQVLGLQLPGSQLRAAGAQADPATAVVVQRAHAWGPSARRTSRR